MTLNPDQGDSRNLVCTGLTDTVSNPHLLFSLPSLYSTFSCSCCGLSSWWQHSVSLFPCPCPLRSVADTPEQSTELMGWRMLWGLTGRRGGAALPAAAEEHPLRLGKYRKGNSPDCDSFCITLAAAFREFQWDRFFCETKCGILLQHVSYQRRCTSSTLRYIVLCWTDLTSDTVVNREKQYENHWRKGNIVK